MHLSFKCNILNVNFALFLNEMSVFSDRFKKSVLNEILESLSPVSFESNLKKVTKAGIAGMRINYNTWTQRGRKRVVQT
jgi:hypothetical protein